ncbi:hypothetical protein NEOKW01_1840 [Nematocida sp. AWRm80]|nr:hypothetical protein NEOKW01_1840 [Nematocida sp. AWRm80]
MIDSTTINKDKISTESNKEKIEQNKEEREIAFITEENKLRTLINKIILSAGKSNVLINNYKSRIVNMLETLNPEEYFSYKNTKYNEEIKSLIAKHWINIVKTYNIQESNKIFIEKYNSKWYHTQKEIKEIEDKVITTLNTHLNTIIEKTLRKATNQNTEENDIPGVKEAIKGIEEILCKIDTYPEYNQENNSKEEKTSKPLISNIYDLLKETDNLITLLDHINLYQLDQSIQSILKDIANTSNITLSNIPEKELEPITLKENTKNTEKTEKTEKANTTSTFINDILKRINELNIPAVPVEKSLLDLDGLSEEITKYKSETELSTEDQMLQGALKLSRRIQQYSSINPQPIEQNIIKKLGIETVKILAQRRIRHIRQKAITLLTYIIKEHINLSKSNQSISNREINILELYTSKYNLLSNTSIDTTSNSLFELYRLISNKINILNQIEKERINIQPPKQSILPEHTRHSEIFISTMNNTLNTQPNTTEHYLSKYNGDKDSTSALIDDSSNSKDTSILSKYYTKYEKSITIIGILSFIISCTYLLRSVYGTTTASGSSRNTLPNNN